MITLLLFRRKPDYCHFQSFLPFSTSRRTKYVTNSDTERKLVPLMKSLTFKYRE